jgi:hypothetical protein
LMFFTKGRGRRRKRRRRGPSVMIWGALVFLLGYFDKGY